MQAQAAKALAQGKGITQIAGATGLYRSTIYRWVKSDDDFRMAMLQGRAEDTLALRDDLRELSEQALQILMRVLADPPTPPAVLVKTSMFILARVPQNRAGPSRFRSRNRTSGSCSTTIR